MSNVNGNVAEAPGVEASKVEIPSIETVEKWVTKDLGTCVTFLQAILNDADLRKQVSIFLHGRMTNNANRADPNQLKMPL